MDMTHATPELMAALSAAQGEIENASKRSLNKHLAAKYADLAEILNTVRPTLAKHGMSVMQAPTFDGSLVHVTTLLAHATGSYVFFTMSCAPAKVDAQGIGAATTYLRRYGLAAMVGIAQEDDDGESAKHPDKPIPAAERPYPDKDFAKNLPAWAAAIESGKQSAQSVIAMVSTKGKLTEAQIEKINACEKGEPA